MVQKLVVEVDSVNLLERYLRLAVTTVLNSQEELAVKVVDRTEKNGNLHLPSVLLDQDKYFPVIFIGGWYSPKKDEENSYFNGYGPWTTFCSDGAVYAVDAVVQHVKDLFEKQGKTWGEQFKKKFGDGYNDDFNHFDGSVGLGYEIRACGFFPEQMAISIVHMYYGK